MEAAQILIVDDEPNMIRVLGALLKREGYQVIEASGGQEALKLLNENHVDALLTDLRMPGMDGMQLLDKALAANADLPVILITAHGTIDSAVEAVKKGAYDFITKPFEWSELRSVIAKAVETARQGSREIGSDSLVKTTPTGGKHDIHLLGASEQMLQVFDVLDKVSDTPSTILITGESGTGKDVIAKEVHRRSRWSQKAFIKVNCAAIPSELLESELFGYEKGAFTGAVTAKPGRFELAHEGTLFLDEIGEMSPEMQVKLLRTVQDREFERVGGLKTFKVETRLITATNIDIKKAVENGRFRQDLYYRLNIVNIHLPPLRERRTDIPPLCAHFLERFNGKLDKKVGSFSDEAMAVLGSFGWPGNIRQLENIIERAVLFDTDGVIHLDDFPDEVIAESPQRGESCAPAEGLGLKEAVKAETSRIERGLILKALDLTKGNVTQAARHLKISRKSMQTKMKELGLRDDGTRQ